MAVQILFIFVLLDYITGMIASSIQGKLSSSQGMVGISKKLMIFIFVAMGHLADIYLSNDNDLLGKVSSVFLSFFYR